MTPSTSSLIQAHRYDPEAKRLTLQFRKGGTIGHYDNVEPDVYERFAASGSQGGFFHSLIKDTYDHTPG